MASEGGGAGGFRGTIRKYWWVGALALAGGLGYFWWKNRSSTASSSTTASGTSSSTDASGIDYSGELSVIQSELESVLAGQGGTGTSGGTSGGGGISGTTSGTTGSSGSGGTSNGGSTPPPSGGTGTVPPPDSVPPGTGKPAPPPAPAGVKVTRKTATQVGLAWTPDAGATDYRCRVTYQGKLVASKTARTPAITIDGLTPDRTYTFHVAATNAGGTGPETNGPAVKTSKS